MNIYSLIEGNLEQGQGMCLWLLNFRWQLGQLAPTCKFLLAGLGCGMLGIGADGNRPGREVGVGGAWQLWARPGWRPQASCLPNLLGWRFFTVWPCRALLSFCTPAVTVHTLTLMTSAVFWDLSGTCFNGSKFGHGLDSVVGRGALPGLSSSWPRWWRSTGCLAPDSFYVISHLLSEFRGTDLITLLSYECLLPPYGPTGLNFNSLRTYTRPSSHSCLYSVLQANLSRGCFAHHSPLASGRFRGARPRTWRRLGGWGWVNGQAPALSEEQA